MGISREEVVSYYDAWAPEYAEQFLTELKNKPLDRYILDSFAELTKGKGQVCDIGCGPGHIAGYMAEKGVNSFGIDLSAGMINEAKQHFPALNFYVADMLELPVMDKQLAGICAFYSVIHLDSTEIPRALKEFRRVILPEGYLLLAFHIGKQEVIRANRKTTQKEYFADVVFHDYETIIREFEENEFELKEALIRYPYREVEYPSRRAYILARKRA